MARPLLSKEAARYTSGGGREHCSLCRHFSPRNGGRCARVLGSISPQGWCKLFSREIRAMVPDASSFNGGAGGPTLGLDFMAPGVLDPRITFTRASVATYFDAAGAIQTATSGTPRWDYDPVTHAMLGLLIEEQRANLLLNSATLGTQSVAVTAQAYTLSFYGTGTITKSGTATGALVGTGAFPQRVSQTFTPTAGSLTLTVTGSVLNAQLEAGPYRTSWMPTTGATATRIADLATFTDAVALSGTGGKTIALDAYAVTTVAATSANTRWVGLNDGTTNNIVQLQQTATTLSIRAVITVATSNLVNTAGVAITRPGAFKAAVANDTTWNGAVNGVAIPTSGGASVAFGPLTTINIGSAAGALAINGYIQRIRYWSRALSAAELQTVTT